MRNVFVRTAGKKTAPFVMLIGARADCLNDTLNPTHKSGGLLCAQTSSARHAGEEV